MADKNEEERKINFKRIYLPLISAGALIIIAITIVVSVPIWHMVIGGMVGSACLVGAFILLAVASDRLRVATKKEKKSGGFIKVRKRGG
jgi:phosphate/sulfate permease